MSLLCYLLHVLIICIKYVKRPSDALWFYGYNFIAQLSPTCFGHSCGHFQGGENKNANIIKMCLNHSTVEKSYNFQLKFTVE